ncbi:HD-GYP domain-containing protein [Piscinibacter sakaiensis]|uniref:HD-GYP domain-containing protein n=1 Tax=Piscinibacter sakaiensis TaxID=1547922 RepID=UPI00372A95FC
MLKRIAIEDARLGMHVHRLEGDWVSHPFWRSQFTLESAADLEKLQASGMRVVWIDLAKGVDVAEPASTHTPTPAPAPALAEPPAVAAAQAPAPRTPAGWHEEQARAVRPTAQRLLDEARLGRLVERGEADQLIGQVMASVDRHPGVLVTLVRLKQADAYTYMHSVAVSALMVALGRQLGLTDASCAEAGLAGLLHDIGKARIAPEILNKPGPLTTEEWVEVRDHPRRGHALLSSRGDTPASVLDACLHHHERADGQGYPDGVAGEDIALLTRMTSVCDVYDAISSDRPYKRAWSPAESIARMVAWKSHFDQDVLKAFVRCLGIYPVGSLVRLASQRLAVVVEHHPGHPAAPIVRAFFSLGSGHGIPPVRIDLRRGRDRIVSHEDPGPWDRDRLQALWLDDRSPVSA